MKNEPVDKERISIRISKDIDKALKYAKIELSKSKEAIVEDALKEYLCKLGFLKESGEVTKPSPVVVPKENIVEE